MLRRQTYKLLTAHNSHDIQWVQSMLLGVEVGVARLVSEVVKDDISYEIRIEVGHLTVRILFHFVLESGRRLRVIRVPAAPVSMIGLIAVAVNIRVGEFAALAVKV